MEKAKKTTKKTLKTAKTERGGTIAPKQPKKGPPRGDVIKKPKIDNLEAKVEQLKEEARQKGLLDNLLFEELCRRMKNG